MKKLTSLFVFAFLFFISSCTYRLADFTIISTKNFDLTRASQFKKLDVRKEGKDLAHIIIFIPIGKPSMNEAIDRAIESTKGAVALVDGVIYSKSFYIPYIYGQDSYIVEGSPLIDPSISMNENQEKDTYTLLTLDKEGNIKNQKSITSEEYYKIKNKIIKTSEKKSFKNS